MELGFNWTKDRRTTLGIPVARRRLRHTCGVASDGSLWCWGDNGRGELGDGTHNGHTTPHQVGTDAGWQQVAAAADVTCGVKTDQTLWCWGANDDGQLGDDSGFSPVLIPVQ